MSKANGDHLLALIRTEFPEYHPLVAIARIAHDSTADLKLQFECHKTISKFIEPELKSVELQSTEEKQTRVVISMFPDKPSRIENGGTYREIGQDIQDIDEIDYIAAEAYRDSER